jgi:TRAP-type C4-dicarboxylate transport system substrate-binding protein
METIINPRTGRKITMNGKVWKSLSPEERKQAEQHTIVTKVKTSEVSKV